MSPEVIGSLSVAAMCVSLSICVPAALFVFAKRALGSMEIEREMIRVREREVAAKERENELWEREQNIPEEWSGNDD